MPPYPTECVYPEQLPAARVICAIPRVTSRPRSKRERESAHTQTPQTHRHSHQHKQQCTPTRTAVHRQNSRGNMNGADQGSSSATPDTNTNAGGGVVDAEGDTTEGTGSNEQQESNVVAPGSTGGVPVISPKPVYSGSLFVMLCRIIQG